jgi:hypothetical protein
MGHSFISLAAATMGDSSEHIKAVAIAMDKRRRI